MALRQLSPHWWRNAIVGADAQLTVAAERDETGRVGRWVVGRGGQGGIGLGLGGMGVLKGRDVNFVARAAQGFRAVWRPSRAASGAWWVESVRVEVGHAPKVEGMFAVRPPEGPSRSGGEVVHWAKACCANRALLVLYWGQGRVTAEPFWGNGGGGQRERDRPQLWGQRG